MKTLSWDKIQQGDEEAFGSFMSNMQVYCMDMA